MTGYVSKDGRHSIWIQKLIGPDGKPLQLFEDSKHSHAAGWRRFVTAGAVVRLVTVQKSRSVLTPLTHRSIRFSAWVLCVTGGVSFHESGKHSDTDNEVCDA